MTPDELRALPVGTKVLFDIGVGDKGEPIFDMGTIIATGKCVTIVWSDGLEQYVGTSNGWAKFIKEISLATQPAEIQDAERHISA
jgi:hypothetical protein